MDKARFLKVYANLPFSIRKDIVLVLDNAPVTWNIAFLEIDNNTKLGEEIFDKLIKLNII